MKILLLDNNPRLIRSFPDAVLLEDVVKQGFGGEAEVGAEDEIDAGDGAAKVFGYKIRRGGGEEGSVYVGKSG